MPWDDNLDLNSPAYNIAATLNSRVRVVAGPGTGKSFAMKRRVARLLEGGHGPEGILPVTFTRVAAEDLHRELVGMGVPGCENLSGQTLHSLSLRMLMRNHVLEVTGRVARPLNEFELEPLVADLMGDFGGKKAVRALKQAYEAAWARLQHEVPNYVQSQEDAQFAAVVTSWLVFHRAMLIGEVIPQLYQYLRNNPGAPERSEFSHILVDEYQDLNRAEQGVIELLSDVAEVCIVGDDDQSIYSFKHAHPEGIQEWTQHNVGADDLMLSECRRCPTRVVAMANSLIAHNQQRIVPRALTPRPVNGQGDVRILSFATLDAEITGVVNLVEDFIANGVEPGEILILAQRGAIGSPIFTALRQRFIPAKSYYAEAELELPEAQRRFALLKLFVSRDDRVALRWLVGHEAHNWNAAGYRRVRHRCEQTGESPWAVLEQLAADEISLPHTANIVTAFNEIVAEIMSLENLADLTSVVDQLFPDGDPSVMDIRTLALQVLDEVDDDREEFLRQLTELIAQPEIPDEVQEVRIMSLHKSKGLSAPVTIISGCIEGLLPKQPDQGTPVALAAAQIEEQRRLFFVGITRVKAEPDHQKPGTLVLTSCRAMPTATALGAGIAPAGRGYGTVRLHASRFLGELGPEAPHPIRG